jgi:hypothetical protein
MRRTGGSTHCVLAAEHDFGLASSRRERAEEGSAMRLLQLVRDLRRGVGERQALADHAAELARESLLVLALPLALRGHLEPRRLLQGHHDPGQALRGVRGLTHVAQPSPIASRLALTFLDRHVPACCGTTHCVADRATSAARAAITLSILETFETCHSLPPRAARVSIT